MNKPVLVFLPQGRTGNQCVQFLFAKAWAERNGYELRHEPFVGEEIFQIDNVVRPEEYAGNCQRVGEDTLCSLGGPGIAKKDLEFRGYALKQSCMIYTKKQAQEWLKFRPEVIAKFPAYSARIAAHRRVGDFIGYGYPVASRGSYFRACRYFGLDEQQMTFLTEENPLGRGDLPEHLSFLPDFKVMVDAPTLLRANSTFSWLAGLLSNGIVLSPVVTGLEGGKEHDVRFISGNHARLSDHDFVSELHVAP